jgi:hypothetical protein
MLLSALLEGRRKSIAIWYMILRQSPNYPEWAFSQSSDPLFGFFLNDPVLRFGSRQAQRS